MGYREIPHGQLPPIKSPTGEFLIVKFPGLGIYQGGINQWMNSSVADLIGRGRGGLAVENSSWVNSPRTFSKTQSI